MPTMTHKFRPGARVLVDQGEHEGEVLFVYPALDETPIYDIAITAGEMLAGVPERRLAAVPPAPREG